MFFQDNTYLTLKNNIHYLELNEQLFENDELQNELNKNFIEFISFINIKLFSKEYNYVKKTTIFEIINIMMFYFSNFMKNKIQNDSGWSMNLYEHIQLIEEVWTGAIKAHEIIFPELSI
jgi:hypothetical protein